MPSPFPGMDPYLERADVFPDLHSSLIVFLKNSLQETIPPLRPEREEWVRETLRLAGR